MSVRLELQIIDCFCERHRQRFGWHNWERKQRDYRRNFPTISTCIYGLSTGVVCMLRTEPQFLILCAFLSILIGALTTKEQR